MPFEKYVPVKPRKPAEATVRKTGTISIPRHFLADHDLANAAFVTLHFDKDRKLVGLKPTSDPREEGAAKLAHRQRSSSVVARSFFDYFRVPLVATRHCPLSFDATEGMLVIALGDIRRRPGRRRSRA